MPFLGIGILLLIGGVVIGAIWYLSQIARYEQRIIRTQVDEILGQLEIRKHGWKCSHRIELAGYSLEVRGWGDASGVSDAQRKTIGFLKPTLSKLINLAILAGKDEMKRWEIDEKTRLTLDGITILEDEGSFELWFVSPDDPDPIPDGVIITHLGEKIVAVEIMH